MEVSIADRELVSSRVFDFAPEKVFAAWADPALLAQWWGPDGFTNRFDIFEFREGGNWRFTMIGPDGTEYLNESVFHTIEPARRIVLEHTCPPHFEMTATLEAQEGGKTKLTWRMLFDDAQTREALKPICVPANEQNFNRLDAVLRTMP